LLVQSQLPKKLKAPRFWNRASGQSLCVPGIYDFEIQIGKKTLNHPIPEIQNLHEDVILRINFIHVHRPLTVQKKKLFLGHLNPMGLGTYKGQPSDPT
jgi:hypothetical protein